MFDVLIHGSDLERTLRIVITSRLVTQSRFLHALEENLAPVMEQAGDSTSLPAFAAQFESKGFHRGTEVAFTTSGTQLDTYIDGVKAGTIASPTLVKGLFEMYLGQDPVAPDAKRAFAQGLAKAMEPE
ncbi:hypothetical protein APUTEX25_000270 [Auxenochlorella protothecoides]|nr:hypothetical protein APUTEX25_000270 [Auxenochlorella protothecoides]|eukprot:RMZ55687.1 hypothetical protein APUTEX25_000270 [Auxenochlorella protothecoides]